MQYKYAEIAETVFFWFAANETTGTAGDGATPLYDVRLAGAAAGAAPTTSGTPTLLSHADYSPGLYEIAIDTTGQAAGEYAVFCTLTISTVNPAGFCGSYKLRTAGTSALKVEPVGAITLASLSVTGQLDAGNMLVDTTTALTGAVTAPAGITGNITGNISGTLDTVAANLATVDGIVDAIKLKTDEINAGSALIWTYTLTDSVSSLPLPDATIRLTSDSAGTVTLRTATTNSLGVATFYFDPSDSGMTVYVWRSKAGYDFSDPDSEVLS